MTIQEARKCLEDLETEIEELIQKFEKETDMEIHTIDIQRFDITTKIDERWKSMVNQIRITTQL